MCEVAYMFGIVSPLAAALTQIVILIAVIACDVVQLLSLGISRFRL